MKGVDTIARIRREFFVRGKTIKEIVRELHVSRNTVRKVLRSGATEFTYQREVQPLPKLGRWKAELDRLLAANEARPARERLTLIRVFEALRALGYEGGYDAVRRYARSRRRGTKTSTDAYIPLTFAPGEAYQFDWSHEVADQRHDGDREARPRPALPLAHAVRAGLPARDAGDGLRRP